MAQRITVPATSANLGPGFDCLGMALALYNSIEFCAIERGFEIFVDTSVQFVPTDERNLVYRVFRRTAEAVGRPAPGIRMVQKNGIPMTRGLGSSAACTVGGVVAANELLGKPLSFDDMLALASAFEGHPDNVLPAMVGGLTVGCTEGKRVVFAKLAPPGRLRCAVFIPDYIFQTKKARATLPAQVPLADAAFNLAHAALLVAAFAQDKLDLLRVAAQDRLHQPYRKRLIPGFDEIVRISLKHGALCACLSGSGAAVIALLDNGYDAFIRAAEAELPGVDGNWSVSLLGLELEGMRLTPVQSWTENRWEEIE